MSDKNYIVVEKSFEYNDEIYHTSYEGDSGGVPKFSSTDKTKAAEKVKELNLKEFKDILTSKYRGINCYYYGFDQVVDYDNKLMSILKVDNLSDAENKLLNYESNPLTDEQLMEVFSCLNLEFYELYEVTNL